MRRRDFFFRQKVTESELDAAFNDVEEAIQSFVESFNYIGIGLGAEVTQATVPNLTVDASGPAIIYDQAQEKIGWTTAQSINMALDENGAATTTGIPGGNEKWLSVFAEFQRTNTDPRVDGFGATINHVRDESFKLNVVQGAPALIGNAIRPGLRTDQILIADVRIENGVVAILNADIDVPQSATSRVQVIYDLPGSPLFVQERNLQDAMQAMLDQVNAFDAAGVTISALTSAGPEATNPPDIPGGSSIELAFQRVLDFLDNRGRLDGANAWTKQQQIDTGVLDTASVAVTDSPGVTFWNKVFEFAAGAGSVKVRLYTIGDGEWALTVNAAADAAGPPTFTADDIARTAAMWRGQGIATAVFQMQMQTDTSVPWSGTWVNSANDSFLIIPDGAIISHSQSNNALNEHFLQIPMTEGIGRANTGVKTLFTDTWEIRDAPGPPAALHAWECRGTDAFLEFALNRWLGTGTEILRVEVLVDMPSNFGALDIYQRNVDWTLGVPSFASQALPTAISAVAGIFTITPAAPWFIGNAASEYIVSVKGRVGDSLFGVRVLTRESVYGNNW